MENMQEYYDLPNRSGSTIAEVPQKYSTFIVPCVKNKDEGLGKVTEEFQEVMRAMDEFKFGEPEKEKTARLHLASELVDLQFAAETALLRLGYNYIQREEIRRMVYLKNKLRGYYDEQEEVLSN